MLTTYTGVKFTPSGRKVYFDLTEPASDMNPAPPIGTAYLSAHLIAKCRLMNVNMFRMPTGLTVQCPGSFRFQAPNGSWYRLSFQPDNFPEVHRLNVTCLASDGGGCRQWSITPSGNPVGLDPNAKNLTRLLQIDPGSETDPCGSRQLLHVVRVHRHSITWRRVNALRLTAMHAGRRRPASYT